MFVKLLFLNLPSWTQPGLSWRVGDRIKSTPMTTFVDLAFHHGSRSSVVCSARRVARLGGELASQVREQDDSFGATSYLSPSLFALEWIAGATR